MSGGNRHPERRPGAPIQHRFSAKCSTGKLCRRGFHFIATERDRVAGCKCRRCHNELVRIRRAGLDPRDFVTQEFLGARQLVNALNAPLSRAINTGVSPATNSTTQSTGSTRSSTTGSTGSKDSSTTRSRRSLVTRQARKIFKSEKYTAAFDLLILSAAPTSLRLPRTELFQGVFLEASDTMQMLIVSPALMLHGVNVGFVDIEKVKKRVRRILSKIGLRFEDFRLQVCEVRKDIFGVRCDDYHAAFADYCPPGFTVGGWKFKTSIYFNGEGETIVPYDKGIEARRDGFDFGRVLRLDFRSSLVAGETLDDALLNRLLARLHSLVPEMIEKIAQGTV